MRFIFLFIFLISTSFALSIDKSWYENATKEGLEKIYTNQTKKITSSKNNLSPEDKEQVEYQLLLLKKLQSVIKEENTFVFQNIECDQVDNERQYNIYYNKCHEASSIYEKSKKE